jgi:hypothetical protein
VSLPVLALRAGSAVTTGELVDAPGIGIYLVGLMFTLVDDHHKPSQAGPNSDIPSPRYRVTLGLTLPAALTGLGPLTAQRIRV